MSDDLKVSVIVPLYHGKKYISSIVKQVEANRICYGGEVELIFVNDSPEDVIEKELFISSVLDITYIINEKNEGTHQSRINGLELATGEYIIFLDQDDELKPNAIASNVIIAEKKKADVVVGNGVAQLDKSDKYLYKYWLMHITVKYIWFYAKFDCRIISPGHCLIRKDVIPDYWKENPLKNNGADDYFLWLLLLSNKMRFEINRKDIFTHVMTGQNVSLDEDNMKLSVIEVLKLLSGKVGKKYINIATFRINREDRSMFVKLVEKFNRKQRT